jgi:RES domain-containing protein
MSDSRVVHLSCVASGTSGVRATIGARHAGTNRAIVADETYQFVWRWAVSGSRDDLLAHEGAERLRLAAKVAPLYRGSITCMRGVRHESTESPTWEAMGPPPPGSHLRGGRYNVEGDVVLYLAETHQGVIREFRGDIDRVWVQQYSIPGAAMRIGDFSPAAYCDEFSNRVFWWTESAGEAGCPAPAAFSQAVAEILRDEFDAILVPGVRGDDSHHYRNVIVFRPSTVWRAWPLQDVAPALLSEMAAQHSAGADHRPKASDRA